MDVLQAIKICRSVRSFKKDPIPEPVLHEVLSALHLAPSASNRQPWRFIVVHDAERKRLAAGAARNQFFIDEAPILIVACGDPRKAQEFHGGLGNSLHTDIAVAMDRMMLTAVSFGLATCWIGSFDEIEIRHILDIPEDIRVVALAPLGYPKDPEQLSPPRFDDRRPFHESVVNDTYEPST